MAPGCSEIAQRLSYRRHRCDRSRAVAEHTESKGIPRRGLSLIFGPINGELFQTYVVQVLVPELRPGDIVVMDDLNGHECPAVRPAIEAAGASLLYLPPYSPDFNPNGNAFVKLRAKLRKAAAMTVDSIWSVIGQIIGTFTPAECRNYFTTAGYDPT